MGKSTLHSNELIPWFNMREPNVSTDVATGTITANGQTIACNLDGYNGVTLVVTGTFNFTGVFEVTYDGTNWLSINGVSLTAATPSTSITGSTPAAYEVHAPGASQVRLRATTYTSGTANVRIIPTVLSQDSSPVMAGANISQVGSSVVAIQSAGSGSRTALVTATALSSTNADVTSAARTASGNSGATGLATDTGHSLAAVINVSAVSGTTPTMDIVLELSFDGGTTWFTAWSAPRITATGQINVPPMTLHGKRRWSWTIGGTSPSFTFTITSTPGSGDAPIIRSLIDRTLNPNAIGGTSALFVEGCSNISIYIGLTTYGGTAFQLQTSPDGVNWYSNAGGVVTPTSTSNSVISVTGICTRFVRLLVPTAGTGAVLREVVIQAMG